MDVKSLVNEILEDAVFQRQPKAYRNAYFIKVLNPGDRRSFFASFRYRSTKDEIFICYVDINLELPVKNTSVSISFLKPINKEAVDSYRPYHRESVTFFHNGLGIVNKTIIEIIKQTVAPLLVEKLNKVEGMYNVSN